MNSRTQDERGFVRVAELQADERNFWRRHGREYRPAVGRGQPQVRVTVPFGKISCRLEPQPPSRQSSRKQESAHDQGNPRVAKFAKGKHYMWKLETNKGERYWFTYDLVLGVRFHSAKLAKEQTAGFGR